MIGQQYSVHHLTRATVSRVSGLLKYHPRTSMAAVLALSSVDQYGPGAGRLGLVVGSVHDGADGVTRMSIEWSEFSGELRATEDEYGARLELEGTATGRSVTADTLSRVLRHLAQAAEAGSSSRDT